jgi:hypothetical protein
MVDLIVLREVVMEQNVRFAAHAFPEEKNLLKLKNHNSG